MAAYHSLILQQFRSYKDYSVEFVPSVNIIVGPNGSGKTNLLEALYALSTGSSFRGPERELITHNADWFKAEGQLGEHQRILTYRRVGESYEKQFTLDGAKRVRLAHHQRVPVVLFEPDHLRLLRQSPSARRDYVDTLLAKLSPDFSWLKHQFERVLLQRNNILKKRLPAAALEDQLFVWDVKFVELASQLVARRKALIATFQEQLATVYSTIARRPHNVAVAYQSSVNGTPYDAALLKLLHANVARDAERGFTSVGPHRDDFAVWLDDAPAAAAASRGEMRSLLLAMKIIELRLLQDQTGDTPLLLLDDVFSELDAARRQALAALAKTHQTLITTTDADAIVAHFLDDYAVIATGR